MKMSRKFITAGVAGIMALGIAVSAWAAEPKNTFWRSNSQYPCCERRRRRCRS